MPTSLYQLKHQTTAIGGRAMFMEGAYFGDSVDDVRIHSAPLRTGSTTARCVRSQRNLATNKLKGPTVCGSVGFCLQQVCSPLLGLCWFLSGFAEIH